MVVCRLHLRSKVQELLGTLVQICMCSGFAPVVQRCRDDAEVVQRWCRSGLQQVQK